MICMPPLLAIRATFPPIIIAVTTIKLFVTTIGLNSKQITSQDNHIILAMVAVWGVLGFCKYLMSQS